MASAMAMARCNSSSSSAATVAKLTFSVSSSLGGSTVSCFKNSSPKLSPTTAAAAAEEGTACVLCWERFESSGTVALFVTLTVMVLLSTLCAWTEVVDVGSVLARPRRFCWSFIVEDLLVVE